MEKIGWRSTRYYQSTYSKQKYRAKQRGIGFHLTFSEWFEWWGEDVDRRGHDKDCLCMCRVNDKGAYELGNIYKDTRSNNAKDASVFKAHWKTIPLERIMEVKSYEPSGLSTRKVAELTGVSKSKVHKIFKEIRKGIS